MSISDIFKLEHLPSPGLPPYYQYLKGYENICLTGCCKALFFNEGTQAKLSEQQRAHGKRAINVNCHDDVHNVFV